MTMKMAEKDEEEEDWDEEDGGGAAAAREGCGRGMKEGIAKYRGKYAGRDG